MGQARLVGGRRVSNAGAVPGLDLLDRWPPSRRPRRRVLTVCYSGPERGALRRVIAILLACGGTGVAGIGQLADGRGRRLRDDGGVEIRIVLDRAEPPAGRLRVVRAAGQAPGPRAGQDIGFTGWLGLLRALYR
jgi:hypothetical protein